MKQAFLHPGMWLPAALLLVVGLGFHGANFASEPEPRGQNWDDWQPLSQGFVARRRLPPNADKPVEQRRLASTQKRYREPMAAQDAGGGLTRARALRAEEAVANALGSALRIPAWFPTSNSRRTPASSVWLRTGEPGLYQVDIEDLAERTGINAYLVRWFARTGRFTLLNEEQPVSWHFDSRTDTLWFAGARHETFYTDINAYQLKSRATPDSHRMRVRNGSTRGVGASTPFRESITFEEEPDWYFSTAAVSSEPDADYWFWDYLFGGVRDVIEVELPLPHAAANGTAFMRIGLRGWTDLYPGDEHRVYAELNGAPVGQVVVWDGFDAAELVAQFDQSLLRADGDNILRLRNIYDPGTRPGQYLDSIDVEYLRLPVADNGRAWLRNVVGGTQAVTGFDSRNIVVLESPESEAVLRRDARVHRDGNGWAVSFAASAEKEYLVFEPAGTMTPLVDAGDASKLRDRNNSVEYLVIAPRDFAETAEALARHRRNTLGSVSIAWLDDIYKEFGAGRTDPFAIARFMNHARASWRLAPSTVVLIGKGSLDHKDRMGYGDSFLPVVMTSNPWSLAASDARLLGREDGNAPFAIGRLPITSNDEGLAYVEKLISHESTVGGDESHRAVVVADNPDKAGDFHVNSDELSSQLTSFGFEEIIPLYHPLQQVRSTLTQSSTWESAYVSYSGHGSSTQIGNSSESFIRATDAALLRNARFPVFTALTCAVGDDTLPATRSLASALVLNPYGGAISSLAPTGLSLDLDAHLLGAAFVDSFFGGNNTLGRAVADAKQQTDGTIRDFMSPMYSVIGDPAVHSH